MQVRGFAVEPVPQQGSPTPPHGSQVPARHTSVAAAHVPLLPPQHDWPLAPQAVHVPVLLLAAPVHSVFAAKHSLLLLVPQHG